MESYTKAWHQIVKPPRCTYELDYELYSEFPLGEITIKREDFEIKTNEKKQ